MNNRYLIGFIAFAFVSCGLCVCLLGIGGAGFYFFSQTPEFGNIITGADPGPEPKINRNPIIVSDDQPTTDELLAETNIPVRDLRILAQRLKYNGQPLPEIVNDTTPVYTLGDQRDFWISDDTGSSPTQFQSTASLQYITDHAYWWVEDGFKVDKEKLQASAQVFESLTYPTTREFFGTEWTPGVDNDPHLSIFLGDVPGVGGYYASLNEFSTEVNPYSNEQEIFFINLNALTPGSDEFDGVLAHEFQHMIHWNEDRNEETWVNEGLSELSSYLNGYNPGNNYKLYLRNPDLQLTTWAHNPRATLPHYGISYLFMRYFLEQFGEETLKAVVADPANGAQGFSNALQQAGINKTFDDVFADFLIANYLGNPTLADGQWGYSNFSPGQPTIDKSHTRFPVQEQSTVKQYGVDYIELESDAPLTIDFTGSTTAQLLDNQAYSGRYQWYSNRGDDSAASLTRAFDLSAVASATLTYQAWFDIEEDWDYAYLEVSTNGGQGWEIIETPSSRNTNPSGNAYGPGYTGSSGVWREETVDLSPYAGQEILLRFEYITDDAVNGPGFALDDLSIPEIGYFDNFETPDESWIAEGFIRTDNLLKQRYTVNIIALDETPSVAQFPLNESNTGTATIGGSEGGHFIMVISAQAPVSTEPASYEYTIRE